jgi:hypothetical protein
VASSPIHPTTSDRSCVLPLLAYTSHLTYTAQQFRPAMSNPESLRGRADRVDQAPPHDCVDIWVTELRMLGYNTLVLADDEAAFLEERRDGVGGGNSGVDDEASAGSGSSPTRLFAIVSGTVDRFIAEWEEHAGAVVRDEVPPPTRLRHCLADGADVHVFDVKGLIPGLEKGDPRLVDLVEGLDYVYASGDDMPGDKREVQNGRFKVYYESDCWSRLRTLIGGGVGTLHQLNYAQCCVGFAHGLASSKKLQEGTAGSRIAQHVELMLERASRCAVVRCDVDVMSTTPAPTQTSAHDASSSGKEGDSADALRRMRDKVAQSNETIRRIAKSRGKATGRNLLAVAPETRQAMSAWVVDLRDAACDAWLDTVTVQSPMSSLTVGTSISDVQEFVDMLGTEEPF